MESHLRLTPRLLVLMRIGWAGVGLRLRLLGILLVVRRRHCWKARSQALTVERVGL